jgi:hypothetical protein
MEWDRIWQTVFCGCDAVAPGAPAGDRTAPPARTAGTAVERGDAAAAARPVPARTGRGRAGTADACGHGAAARAARAEDDDVAGWVCRRIQQAF